MQKNCFEYTKTPQHQNGIRGARGFLSKRWRGIRTESEEPVASSIRGGARAFRLYAEIVVVEDAGGGGRGGGEGGGVGAEKDEEDAIVEEVRPLALTM